MGDLFCLICPLFCCLPLKIKLVGSRDFRVHAIFLSPVEQRVRGATCWGMVFLVFCISSLHTYESLLWIRLQSMCYQYWGEWSSEGIVAPLYLISYHFWTLLRSLPFGEPVVGCPVVIASCRLITCITPAKAAPGFWQGWFRGPLPMTLKIDDPCLWITFQLLHFMIIPYW